MWLRTLWAYPQIATLIVEPYNTVLRAHSLLERTYVTVVWTAFSVRRLPSQCGIKQPTYTNINRLLAHIISSLPELLRFNDPFISAEKAVRGQLAGSEITMHAFELEPVML